MSEIQSTITRFIAEEIMVSGDAATLTPDRALLDERILDSLGLMKLVMFLEEDFGIAVDDVDIVPENFANIDSITSLVSKLTTH